MGFEALRANVTRKFQQVTANLNTELTAVANSVRNSLITPIINGTDQIDTLFRSNATMAPSARSAGAYDATPGPVADPVPPSQFQPGVTQPPWPNELQDFSSFNVIIQLAVLSAEEINDPDGTYRQNGPKYVVLRNGGGAAGKKVRTAYENALGKDVEFFLDDLEFEALINDIGTKNTNATKIKFNLLEPYSMGLFLQALQLAATTAGYKDYIGAPILLTLDFVGYDENNNSGRAPYARRMFPIKLTKATFAVDAGGSRYACEALAWNDQALMDLTQGVRNDITIKGRSVQELLQTGLESLTSILNQREIEEQARGIKSTGDHYVVMFPTTKASAESNPLRASEAQGSTATVDPSSLISSGVRSDLLERYRSIRGSGTAANGYGDAQFGEFGPPRGTAASNGYGDSLYGEFGPPAPPPPPGFDQFVAEFQQRIAAQSQIGQRIQAFAEQPSQTSFIGQGTIVQSFVEGGSHPFGRNGFTYNEETGVYSRNGVELTLSDDLRTFKFKAGTRIQDIITEIVVVSDFGQRLVQELENIQDPSGFVTWFKIETQVYSIPDNNEVDRSGKTPNVYVFRVVPYQVHHSLFMAPTGGGVGYGNLKREAAKQYNYIYTGKNQDIIDFEIQYDKQFYTVQRADAGNLSASTRVGAANQAVATNPEPTNVQGGTPNPTSPAEGVAQTQQTVTAGESSGGGEIDNSAIAVARMFQEQFNNSHVDLARLKMTIMGDPFYITDSGLGNYNAPDTSYRNMNLNGSMNHQNGEVDVNVIFRTPIDYNEEGGMDFPEDTKIVEAFSGLYRVTKVKTNISGNAFTQELTMLRRRNQTNEAATANAGAFRAGTSAESINDAIVSLQRAADGLQVVDPATIAAAQEALATALPAIQSLGSFADQAQAALNSGVLGQLNSAAESLTGQLNAALGSIDVSGITQDFNAALSQVNAAASAAQSAQQQLSNIGSTIRNNLPPLP